MSKAVTEITIGAAALGAAVLVPGAGMVAAASFLHIAGGAGALTGALVSLGGSQILAGLADSLRPNNAGIAVGVTTPIGPWQYVYGHQKVGGVEIFRESNNNTGVSGGTSNNKQLHRVYDLACHPCRIGPDWQLRIDGKQVIMQQVGSDWVSVTPTQVQKGVVSATRSSGVVTMVLDGPLDPATDGTTLQMRSIGNNTFNGAFVVTLPNPSDLTTWTYVCGGPDATTSGGNARTTFSDYKDKIRVSFLDGNHTATFPTLLAAGTSWKASDLCLGHTLAYVQMGYDDSVFPSSIPNVSFIIDGKNDILDPRFGVREFTTNAALCIADFMSLAPKRGGFGLVIGTDIPNTPLIAAANTCDELVSLAAGGFVRRYSCNTTFSLDTSRGTILKDMLSSCAGRISYQGGQYMIFPAAWVGPTLVLTDSDLAGPIRLKPRLPIRETANSIKGTYISPENAYQIGDVPAYAQDAAHGYVADPWLAEDNGERIYRDAHFPCTNDSAIAQRLAKIALMRMRWQKRITIVCNMKAYQVVALDVIQITHPRYNWLLKNFEVLATRFVIDNSGGALRPKVELDLAETDPSVFDWSVLEQLTPQGYRQPNNVGVRVCNPPEEVMAYSGPGAIINGITFPSTITTGADGRVQNSIYVRWLQPNDANVVFGGHLEVQFQLATATTWTGLAKVDPSADHVFIPNVTDGADYNIQVRAVNTAGVPSEWVFIGPVTAGNSYSSGTYSLQPVAPDGTLSAQGLADGTAQITVLPFTPSLGTFACTPVPAVISGLLQHVLYHVYYVDPTFAGGNITPIATQNRADYEYKPGHLLIGSITTPGYTVRYQPSRYTDLGANTTTNPAAAYDNDVTTEAVVVGVWFTSASGGTPVIHQADGHCAWSGFPSITLSADMTLYVIAASQAQNTGPFSGIIQATFGGSTSVLATLTGTTSETTYSLTVPAGTDLSTVLVEAIATATAGSSPGQGAMALQGFEIYVQ
jgi:hypothetical protein